MFLARRILTRGEGSETCDFALAMISNITFLARVKYLHDDQRLARFIEADPIPMMADKEQGQSFRYADWKRRSGEGPANMPNNTNPA